jgi:glycosyltransferase involved in cell wall biosynthesis
MRVLISAVAAKSGGAATYIANLARELSESGDRYIFLVPTGTRDRITVNRPDIEFIQTDIAFNSAWKRFFWDQLWLRLLVRRYRADLLVSTSDYGMFFATCPQLLLVRNALFFSSEYRKRILTKKRLLARLDYWIRQFLVRASVCMADRVVTTTTAMIESVARDLPLVRKKATVNPFGAPLEKFQAVSGKWGNASVEKNDSFRVLYVSEYADYKNLGVLLKALKELRRNWSGRLSATITMDPETFCQFDSVTEEEDHQLSTDSDVAECVRFTGGVAYAQIHELYREADVFAFPSMVESFGHPLVEAMACGVPVVASDIAVHREVCGDAALYFEPSDYHALAARLGELAESRDLRIQLREKGLEKVHSMLSWSGHVRRLEAQMRSLVVGDGNS